MSISRIGVSPAAPAARSTSVDAAKPVTQFDRDVQSLKDMLRELTQDAAATEKAKSKSDPRPSGVKFQGGHSEMYDLILQNFKGQPG